MHTCRETGGFDPLPEIVEIIRDAIRDGLIDEPFESFEWNLKTLSGYDLEEYLQCVWDKI